jgi:hypothetical protein
MLSDQELDNMLSRSIEVGKHVEPSQEDTLEKKYSNLIHGLMGIHQFYIKSVEDMQGEIEIVQKCFNAISERFVR